jgi:hypothetical protein
VGGRRENLTSGFPFSRRTRNAVKNLARALQTVVVRHKLSVDRQAKIEIPDEINPHDRMRFPNLEQISACWTIWMKS